MKPQYPAEYTHCDLYGENSAFSKAVMTKLFEEKVRELKKFGKVR